MSLPADAFPPDEDRTIEAFIEDLDGGGGALKLDPWMCTEVVPKAMARIILAHVPDSGGVCISCGRRPCPLRQTALAYTNGLVADGGNFDGGARTVARGVAQVPEPAQWPRPYVAPPSTGRYSRPPADGSTS